jgi:hypothetical protein
MTARGCDPGSCLKGRTPVRGRVFVETEDKLAIIDALASSGVK